MKNYSNWISRPKAPLLYGLGWIWLLFSISTLNGQDNDLNLKYLGPAGWEITDGTVTDKKPLIMEESS